MTVPIWDYIHLPQPLSSGFFHYFLFLLFYKLMIFVQECPGADENPLSYGHLRHQDVLGTIGKSSFPALAGSASPRYHCKFHDKFHRSYKPGHFWFMPEVILICYAKEATFPRSSISLDSISSFFLSLAFNCALPVPGKGLE